MIDLKRKALAKFLECDANDLNEVRGQEGEFCAGRKEYAILTDEEADQKAREYILDSVWSFTPEFIASHAREGVSEEVIKTIQDNGKCESNNPALRRLIVDEDHFVEDAIKADGRGHFLSSYDGAEHEVTAENEEGERITFYVYRLN